MAKVQGLNARLDSLEVGSFHRRLLLVSGLGWMFDAMDVLLISFILAALGSDPAWKLSPDVRGYVLSAGFVGMFIGAAASGWLADRIGRKTLFQSTLLLYSLATGLCALVPTPSSPSDVGLSLGILLALRVVVGLGLGGELPVASTLVSEFSPARRRGLMVVLLESFWAFGAVLAALIGYQIIPAYPGYGWRIAFALGALPALYVLALRRGIPESARYLESKGRFAEAEAVVRQVETGVAQAARPTSVATSAASGTQRTSVGDLFQGRYARRTTMLWILWFGIVFSYYGIFTWLPSILDQQFANLTRAFEYVLIITVAQIPGYFSAVYLVERWGRKPTLATYLLVCAVGALFFRQASSPMEVIVWGSVLSFFNLGAWGVVYTYTPEHYPTRIRATGAGFAAGFGRIGGIIGPYVVALLLTNFGANFEAGRTFIFVLFAVVFFVIAADVLALGEETKGESLEELAR